jgi:hypothetical protein
MIKVYKSIYEAIPLSKVRPYLKGAEYKDRVNDWFDGKYRVYIKLNKSKSIGNDLKDSLESEINQAISNTQFELKDLDSGIAFDKKNKREVKLGKVLGKISKDLLNRFNSAEFRAGKNIENPIMVISRHPYDILGQSFDRGWTSCKELGKGSNERYLKDEIFQTLVAYLIYPDDKNIKRPIARVLAIPYFNNKFDLAYVVRLKIYGSPGDWESDFISEFQKWIDGKQGKKSGKYKISPFVYNDDAVADISFDDKNNLPDWIKMSGNIPEKFQYNQLGYIEFWGTWKTGIWKTGTWKTGIWETGFWESGIWETGIWKTGTWKTGTWKGGFWEGGIWKSGTWKDGIWKTGTWEGGTWKSGTWKSGTWKGGFWETGIWETGTWKGGTWETGTWKGGFWKDGIWESGTWKYGTWEGGIWETGLIYDPDKWGNFQPDWKWERDYVRSSISPKEYFGY